MTIREEESDEREDEVIAQDPAGGSRIESGETVTITVSTGREQVDVPNVTGVSPADAAAILRRAGLHGGVARAERHRPVRRTGS